MPGAHTLQDEHLTEQILLKDQKPVKERDQSQQLEQVAFKEARYS